MVDVDSNSFLFNDCTQSNMDYSRVPALIAEICRRDATSFRERTEQLFRKLHAMDREAVTRHIEYGGVIPESYSHDSSEEKLFAKYCDFLLAKALEFLGMKSSVIEERSDSADVLARTKTYSLVGDAKAFRLSRTAKNQKDFKVEALSQWKKDAEYACLVCPLYQYPTTTSQIYDQAIRYNVTLLSFTHLGFLLRADSIRSNEFAKIWKVSSSLDSGKEAVPYWNAITHQVTLATGQSIEEWDKYLLDSKNLLREQAQEQLAFWKSEKDRIRRMDHDTAVTALISALRIDSNISLITRTLSELDDLIAGLD
jgi:hypothetical protein